MGLFIATGIMDKPDQTATTIYTAAINNAGTPETVTQVQVFTPAGQPRTLSPIASDGPPPTTQDYTVQGLGSTKITTTFTPSAKLKQNEVVAVAGTCAQGGLKIGQVTDFKSTTTTPGGTGQQPGKPKGG
jgi:hypothetical protein